MVIFGKNSVKQYIFILFYILGPPGLLYMNTRQHGYISKSGTIYIHLSDNMVMHTSLDSRSLWPNL